MKKQKLLTIGLILSLSLSILVACQKQDSRKIKTVDTNKLQENGKNTNNKTDKTNKIAKEYGITVDKDTVSLVDALGEEVKIKKKPERVVVLFSSYIDMWVKNGGQLVGMVEDENMHNTSGLDGVEGVGKTGGLSLEKIISLEPDLVILSTGTTSQRELIPALKNSNIDVLPLEYIGKDDYFKIATLFSLINEREDLYEKNVVEVKKQIDEVIEKTPKDEEKKVFIMFATSKAISSRGSDSTLGEMLKDLNTINIADTSSDVLNDKNFSLEKVLEEDPEFIFVQTRGSDMEAVNERIKKDVESNPAWASLSAIKNDKYIILPKDLYLYKANDRYGEAYEGLAKILYPDIFK